MGLIDGFLGLGKTIEEAEINLQRLVQTSLASVNGNLQNPNGGLIPFVINSLDGFVDRNLIKLDTFVNAQLNKLSKIRIVH